MIFETQSPEETQKLAGFLLEKIKNSDSEKAAAVALEGELGAGKTVLVQALAKELGIKAKVKSPTFTLLKKYPIPNKIIGRKYLYHLDCYRLKDHKELEPLGIAEILNDPTGIVLIEWSDRVKKILPKEHIKIHIDHIAEKKRKISIEF
jgi:tRNA threonylcarbamoyladenosine biosynthesis protein TsaE